MPKSQRIVAAAVTALLLAACGSRAPTAAENEAADSPVNVPDNASPSEPGPVNGSDQPSPDSVPPPDAVSHPEGYLPPAPAPEPETNGAAGSRETPPATEDEYIRNRQAGR